MIVLGIDPGSVKMGWSIIQVETRKIIPVTYGVIRMNSKTPLFERLCTIGDELERILDTHKPEAAGVEGVFQSTTKNLQSALKLSHARGAAIMTIARRGIPVHEYPPAEVKKALTGSGRADKIQVREMVRSILGIRKIPAEDAADALAVAVCHGFREQIAIIGGRR